MKNSIVLTLREMFGVLNPTAEPLCSKHMNSDKRKLLKTRRQGRGYDDVGHLTKLSR